MTHPDFRTEVRSRLAKRDEKHHRQRDNLVRLLRNMLCAYDDRDGEHICADEARAYLTLIDG